MATYTVEQARVGAGRGKQMFIVPEVTFGTLVDPTATDLVLRTDEAIAKQGFKTVPDTQKRSTRTKRQPIKTKDEVGKFSFSVLAKPSGTPGTAPEIADVLDALFGSKLTPTGTGTTIAGSTTLIVKGTVGDGAKFSAGMLINIDVSATTTAKYEQRVIASITTDELTVTEAFSAAPAVGKTIYGLITWVPANTAGSVSIWEQESEINGAVGAIKAMAGVKLNSYKGSIQGDGALVQLDFDVSYQTEYRCGRDQLAVAMLIGDTSMTLHNSTKFDVNMYTYIESEVVKITAINYTTHVCTVTRAQKATAAAAHAIETVVYPWLPAGTEVGTPVSGYLGQCQVESVDMDVISVEWSMDQKPSWRENIKNNSAIPQEGTYPEERELTLSAKAYLEQENQKWDRTAEQATVQFLVAPAGDTPGGMVVAYFSNFTVQKPDISGAGDQEISLTADVFGTSAGNDEHRLGMC